MANTHHIFEDFLRKEVVAYGGSPDIYCKVMDALREADKKGGPIHISDLRKLAPSGGIAAEHMVQHGIVHRRMHEIRDEHGVVRGSFLVYSMPREGAAEPKNGAKPKP